MPLLPLHRILPDANTSGHPASIITINTIDGLPASNVQSALEKTVILVNDTANTKLSANGGTINGNLVVTGNVDILGNTTTINTEVLSIEDKNIVLANVSSPTDITANGGGITLLGSTDKTLIWEANSWNSSEDFNLSSGKVFKIGNTEVLSNTSLSNTITNSALTSLGTLCNLKIDTGSLTEYLPAINVSTTWANSSINYTALHLNVANTNSNTSSNLLDLRLDGISKSKIDYTGTLTSYRVILEQVGSFFQLPINAPIYWYGTSFIRSSAKGEFSFENNTSANYFKIVADGQNILSLKNSTNAQTFRLYRTYTDDANTAYTALTQNANTGFILDSANNGTAIASTNLLDVRANGVSKFYITKSGKSLAPDGLAYSFINAQDTGIGRIANDLTFYSGATPTARLFSGGGLTVDNVSPIGFTSGAINSTTQDVFIYRDTANILAQRNSTNAQTLRVYNTYTDSGNNEFGHLSWSSNAFAIGTVKNGTGSARNLVLQTDNTDRLTIDPTGNVAIGLSSTNYKLEVNGSTKANSLILTANTISTNTTTGTLVITGGVGIFGALNATTKSFDIVHPSDPNKRLQYGSLESPSHSVRLTGKGVIVNGRGIVELPKHLKDLIDEESITIQLTNIKHTKILFVMEINLSCDYFMVGNDTWNCIPNESYQFYWSLTGERTDVPKLVVEY